MQPTHLPLPLAVLLLSGTLLSGSAVHAEVPAFVKESLYSPNVATVAKVAPTLATDIVILDGGLEQGIRLGMVCRVTRGLQSIGELIIIESRSDQSAGLILELAKGTIIQAGDVARIKTIQNS